MTYRLTVRQGPKVSREKYEDLGAAIGALERHVAEIRASGPLEPRTLLREFESSEQVAGRVEISTGSLLRRGSDAGIDVMGDGTLVPFAGGMRRVELDSDQPYDAVRDALA